MFTAHDLFGFSTRTRAALAVVLLSVVTATLGYLWASPATAPARVQRILQKYTGPAVAVGASVREIRTSLGTPFAFVPHLGYVAHVGDSTGVSELRLLLPSGKRAGGPNDADRPDAVEILTTSDGAFNTLAMEVSAAFRDPPREGCLTMSQPGTYREVRYWQTPLRFGGIALTNDYGGNRSVARQGMVVTGLLAFAGRFKGGETMRGNYSPQPCALLAGRGTPTPKDLARVALASDSLTMAFADSAAGRALAAEPPTPTVTEHMAHACEEPTTSVEFIALQSGAVSLTLPVDFTPIDTARVASDGIHRWLGADKSTVVVRPDGATYHSGWTGSLTSECTVDIAGARAHIDLADATVEVPDYVVRAVLERPGMLPFVFEGHARSVRRQAELLRALRSLSVAEGAWVPSVVVP